MDRKRISRVEKSIPVPSKPVPRKRLDDQMRSIFAHVGTVKNAQGSSYIEAENIKIICSVYTKQQKDLQGQLYCDFKFAPFSTPERRGYHKDEQERDFSTQLEQALSPCIRMELYENTRIEVYCLVLESDGLYASLAHGITCASLALAHANIELFDVCIGSSGGHSTKSMIDLAENETVDSNIVLATMPHLNEITLVLQTGKSQIDQSLKKHSHILSDTRSICYFEGERDTAQTQPHMLSRDLKKVCKEHLDLFYKNSHSHRDYEKEVSLLLSKIRFKYSEIQTDRFEQLVDLLRDNNEILWFLFKLDKSTVDTIKDKPITLLSLGKIDLPEYTLEELKNDWTRDYSGLFVKEPGFTETISSIDSAYQSDQSSDMSLHVSDLASVKEEHRNLLSWEKYKDTDISSPFLTQGGYKSFQVAYLDYKKTLIETAEDMPLIDMNQLVSKLILVCNGMESDLLVYRNGHFQTTKSIRSGGIGIEALQNVLKPFLEHGDRIRFLQGLVQQWEKSPFKVGLTGLALANSVNQIMKLMYSQTASLTVQIHKKALNVLQLQYNVTPMFQISQQLVELFKDAKDIKGISLLNIVYNKMIESETNLEKERFRGVLFGLFQGMLQPLLCWMDNWLQITRKVENVWEIQNFNECDPYNEFFIQQEDHGEYVFIESFEFLPFLTRDFAKELFETGKMSRQLTELNGIAQYHSNFDIKSRWVVSLKDLKVYKQNIESFCKAQLHARKQAFVEAEIHRVNELERIHQEQLEKVSKQELVQQIKAELEQEKQASLVRANMELKENIEAFLEEKRLYLAQEMQKEKDLEKKEKVKEEAEQRQRNLLLQDEMKRLEDQYHRAMERMDLVSDRLEWRRKRFELDLKRRDLLAKDWVDTLAVEGLSIQEEKSDSVSVKSESLVLDQSVLPAESILLDAPVDAEESVVLDLMEESQILEPVVEKEIQVSLPVIETDEQTISKPEPVPEPKRLAVMDHISQLDKLNFVCDPSVIQLEQQQEKIIDSTDLYDLYTAVNELQLNLVSIDSTIQSSMLTLWKKQAALLTSANLSCLFTLSGRKDPRDIRFHFEVLNSFYMFGSGHFQSRVVDRLFKTSYTGLSLNSLLTNISTANVRDILGDVFEQVVDSKGTICNPSLLEMISMDIRQKTQGVDITNSMELWYKVPQPFDYFIDKEMLGQFQKVFLLILTLLQSQEAFSRILMTKKWKKYHRGSQDHALIVPFIQQCQIFLSGFQHYAFHTSIAVPWKQLETEMDILADRVHVVNMDLSKPVSISLVKQMIKTHSDQIRSNLFLMEDQDLLQSTIKDLFGLVIQFSRFMQDMPIQETLASLYFQFKAKFKTLIQIANDKKYLSSTELERKTAENLEVLLFSICPNIENE